MSASSGVKPEARVRFSLSRWSERKLEAARTEVPRPTPRAVPPITATPMPTAITSPPDLPPIESLTFDSDFAAFLQPGVNETLRRMALKKLLRDPRFNVMDGLDTYVEDYSQPDPIPLDLLARLRHAKDVLDPSPHLPEPQAPVVSSMVAAETSSPSADGAVPAVAEPGAAPGPDPTGAAVDAPQAERSKASQAAT